MFTDLKDTIEQGALERKAWSHPVEVQEAEQE